MIELQNPTIAEPWRVLGNVADEIVTRLEKPHSQHVGHVFKGEASPDLRFSGGEAWNGACHESASDART